MTSTEDYVSTLMQDVIMLKLINVSFNSYFNKDNDRSPLVVSAQPSISIIPMDTSSSNDTFIKKVNNKKKKKLKQKTEMVGPIEVVQPLVLTNMLIDVDSTIHLLFFNANVAIQRAQVTIKKNSCIKNIKAIKHKKEYLKSIKAEESSSNCSVNYCSTESVPSVIVKFSKHEGLVKAANYFKHDHHTGRMKLITKTYYRMGRDRVSCREFKIINVSLEIDLDSVEQAIRFILKDKTFYLRHPSKHIFDKNSRSKDIFFTASSSTTCNLLKQTWFISIDKDVFRLTPTYFKKSDIELRNSHVEKFSGFSPNHNLAYIKDNVQNVTNLKNVYRRTDDNNIYLEFASESDLFNACSSNIFIDKLKIKGIPRGTNWADRDAFLNSHCNKYHNSSYSTYKCAITSNRIPIISPRWSQKDSLPNISDELLNNPWNSQIDDTSTSKYNNFHNSHLNTNEGCGFTSSNHNFPLPNTSEGHTLNLDINNNNSHLQDLTLYPILQPQPTENDTHNDVVDSFVRSQKDNFLQQSAFTSLHSNRPKTMDVTHHKQISSLKLLYNNVNGLRNYNLKLTYLIDYVASHHFLIIGATETNIDQNTDRFINIHQDYTAYFSEHNTKNKGSGVAIIIQNHWSKHLGKIDRHSPYYIEATFYF
ncbi:hypothetical protein C1645_836402 [Glomus cerebriforme]|uniref:Uncharacterized protein n=1 Tax=Glomus cerebriforme TaxID=658196 RepID=A0A397SBV2_9GLOM|nr:hypothetical protein C1645_836402 [Glomus cerebriforme]